jgi:GH25 family lysozyme M1 (1,4-beta-N-acetylmuramidase)
VGAEQYRQLREMVVRNNIAAQGCSGSCFRGGIVFASLRRVTVAGRYPMAAMAIAFAAIAGEPGMTGPAGQPPPSTVSRAGAVWAVNASGQKVPVTKPTFVPTPIHPEKLTHPGADYMGAVNVAHAPWGRSEVAGPLAPVPQLPGIDVSSYQGIINWASVAPYIDFSYAKATEGIYYTNPDFYNQYVGPYRHGVIRGAYHFAIPNNSTGQSQADFFIKHGGGWSSDGLTLPGVLDIEYNPYGSQCYRLTRSQMVSWIWNFVHEYAYKEHAYPVIYTNANWWSTCTGNYSGFGTYDPLWIAYYAASAGPLPTGWGFYTFWQYAPSGKLPGDQDVFNGSYTRLKALAING